MITYVSSFISCSNKIISHVRLASLFTQDSSSTLWSECLWQSCFHCLIKWHLLIAMWNCNHKIGTYVIISANLRLKLGLKRMLLSIRGIHPCLATFLSWNTSNWSINLFRLQIFWRLISTKSTFHISCSFQIVFFLSQI